MRKTWSIQVNSDGSLLVPPALADRFGLKPGATVLAVEAGQNDIHLLSPVTHLRRIYIEVTNVCNLECTTCIRNVWEEGSGFMPDSVFERILNAIKSLPLPVTVFIGGFGEPLSHPNLSNMVQRMKEAGAIVELITNATLLDGKMSLELMKAGLDTLWFSMDGATPDSFADVRLGAALPTVLKNIRQLQTLKHQNQSYYPRLGLAYVAMRRNIADLPAILQTGRALGVSQFSISNVLPHTKDMRQQILYHSAQYNGDIQISEAAPIINMPRIDINHDTLPALSSALSGDFRLSLAGFDLAQTINTCPFIARGSVSIRWDGQVSSCLSLLHAHDNYLGENLRHVSAFLLGSIMDKTLAEIWNQPDYIALRQRIQNFDFSPCVYCNSCDMSEHNQMDCFGNDAPTCGGCLWAQGLIQCP